ncbi:MAG: potassium-transporting ATPase subunit KdpC [Methanoregulaceae archaeon]|jgi:K+-transporting ATPase ATPase C chain|nr:potassium-transporting ATPase subunit KdpC [Methanoregulaceae archaeon]
MRKDLKTGLLLFLVLFLLTGILYPLVITAIGTAVFPYQAGGSLVTGTVGTVRGSLLIGQEFSGRGYFIGRPSATAGSPYNGKASGGSNLGPTNPALFSSIDARIADLKTRQVPAPFPSDLVMSSASGLDPHISLAAALAQVPVVARERNMTEDDLEAFVLSHAEQGLPFLSVEPYVNVFLMNSDLDNRYPLSSPPGES